MAVLALIAAGCGPAADTNVIKIGEYASLTGKEATFGQSSHNGTELAIDELNAAGGLLAATEWTVAERKPAETSARPVNELRAWATPPFAACSENRLAPSDRELVAGETGRISIESLYLDEADEGALVVASSRD